MPYTLPCLAEKATKAVQESCASGQPLSLSCLRLLIVMGADIDAKDSEGYTPLMHATLLNDADKVRILLACGARPDLMGPNGQEALHMANSNGFAEIARMLTFAYNTSRATQTRKFSSRTYGLG